MEKKILVSTLWNKCLNYLQNTIPRQQFVKYISPLQIKIIKDNLTIFVPNYYILDKITNYYLSTIKNTIQDISKKKYNIDIKIGSNISETQEKNEIDNSNKKHNKSNLNVELNFNNFFEGESNKFVKLVSLEIINNLGSKYNPLHIYGDYGIGKTHILNAIGNEIIFKNKNTNILYNKSEKFVCDMITAIKTYNITEFKNIYRNKDILILDDIQFFSGKNKSQEEIFHTINSLIENKKQVILSSNKHPKDIKNIKKNLRSIITSGIIIKIKKINIKKKIKILINKIKKLKIEVKENIIEFIAKNINTNIRDLESILNDISININIKKNTITIPFIKKIILNKINKKIKKNITIKKIMYDVANFYNVKIVDLISKKRNKTTVITRHIIFYLSKIMTKKSLSEIGEELGKYNHTTVLYSYKKIFNIIKNNKNFKNEIEVLIKLINK